MIDVTCFNWIKMIQKSTLTSNAKYVAHYLSTFMNQNQDIAWPSQSRMVSEMGISKDTLCKKLDELDSHGWIVRERGGPKTTTKYMINVPVDAVEKYALKGSTITGLGSTTTVLGSTTTVLGVVRPSDTNNNSNNKVIGEKRKRFVPPTLDEVKEYCSQRNNVVDCERFIDFYESKGWMIGKNKMKCWKSAVRTWEKSQPKNKSFEGIL